MSYPDWYKRWHFRFVGDVPVPELAKWEYEEIAARVTHDATPEPEPEGPPEKELPEVATGVFDPHDITWLEGSCDGKRSGGSFRSAAKRQKHAVHIYNAVTGADDWRKLGSDTGAIQQFLESIIAPGPLEAISAPIKQGRQSSEERARREQLARLAAAARKRGATEEAIGAVLGGRSKQRIHDLTVFASQLPREPFKIAPCSATKIEPVSRECEECGSTESVMRRERLIPRSLGVERRRLCEACAADWQKPGLRLVS